jgi:hypothetical protein
VRRSTAAGGGGALRTKAGGNHQKGGTCPLFTREPRAPYVVGARRCVDHVIQSSQAVSQTLLSSLSASEPAKAGRNGLVAAGYHLLTRVHGDLSLPRLLAGFDDANRFTGGSWG